MNSPWIYRVPADDREPWERLRDAVETHLRNKAKCLEAALAVARSEPNANGIFRLAERREAESYAHLATLIEDQFCLPADKLKEALS